MTSPERFYPLSSLVRFLFCAAVTLAITGGTVQKRRCLKSFNLVTQLGRKLVSSILCIWVVSGFPFLYL